MDTYKTDSIGRAGVHAVGAAITELGWIFREQTTSDFGVDAQAEAPDENGDPSGRMIALQIKSGQHWFREETSTGIIFRGDLRHLSYWQQHSLPVVLVLYNPATRVCLWGAISDNTIEATGKGWKTVIPFHQRLDGSTPSAWLEFLAPLGSAAPKALTQPLDKIMRFSRAYCQVSLRKVGRKYRRELYVPRRPDQQVWEALTSKSTLGPRVFVLVEKAGSGKTNLVCQMTERLLDQGVPCALLLGSDPFEDRFGLIFEVLRAFGISAESPHELPLAVSRLRDMARTGAFSILIDAINEARNVDKMKEALSELLAQLTGIAINVFITCREIYWSFLKGDWTEILQSDIRTLGLGSYDAETWVLVRNRYFAAFRINGTLTGEADYKCRHPLLFRFFCEAYEGEDVSVVTEIRLKPLFERYLQKKTQRIATQYVALRADEVVLGALQAIASQMLASKQNSLPEATIPDLTRESAYLSRESLYVRLLDEDIILEEIPDDNRMALFRRVKFVYEAFFEFMLARVLSHRWGQKTNDEVMEDAISLLSPSDCMRNILGAFKFMPEFFATRKLSVWKHLAERNDAWQDVVMASLRESEVEENDPLLLEAFPAILHSNRYETRLAGLQLLTTSKARRILDPEDQWLIERLRADRRKEIRWDALKILLRAWGELGSEQRLQVVESVIDPCKEIRKQALKSLDRLTLEERNAFFPFLTQALLLPSGARRSYAALALRLDLWPEGRSQILSRLTDSNPWVRRASLIQLQKAPRKADVAAITPLLTDPERAVRSLVARLIENWKYTTFLDPLVRQIAREGDDYVLSRTVHALLSIKHGDAGLLRHLLDHPNKWVRCYAGRGLFRVLGLSCADDLVASHRKYPLQGGWFQIWPHLKDIGGRKGLRKLCTDGFSSEYFSRETGGFLAGCCTSAAGRERSWMPSWFRTELPSLPLDLVEAYLLGLCQDVPSFLNRGECRKVLTSFLTAGRELISLHVCHCLAWSGTFRPRELEPVLHDPDPRVRLALLESIERNFINRSPKEIKEVTYGIEMCQRLLEALMRHAVGEPAIQIPATRALLASAGTGLGPPEALGFIQNLLASNDSDIPKPMREELLLRLLEAPYAEVSGFREVPEEIEEHPDSFLRLLSSGSFCLLPNALQLCQVGMRSGRTAIARVSLDRLVRNWPEALADCENVVVELAGSRNRALRCTAARAFSHLRAPVAIPHLQNLVRDREHFVRCAALTSLARVAKQDAQPELLAALKDIEAVVRLTACRRIAELKNRAFLDELFGLARDTSWQIRAVALVAIALIDRGLAIRSFSMFSKNDREEIWKYFTKKTALNLDELSALDESPREEERIRREEEMAFDGLLAGFEGYRAELIRVWQYLLFGQSLLAMWCWKGRMWNATDYDHVVAKRQALARDSAKMTLSQVDELIQRARTRSLNDIDSGFEEFVRGLPFESAESNIAQALFVGMCKIRTQDLHTKVVSEVDPPISRDLVLRLRSAPDFDGLLLLAWPKLQPRHPTLGWVEGNLRRWCMIRATPRCLGYLLETDSSELLGRPASWRDIVEPDEMSPSSQDILARYKAFKGRETALSKIYQRLCSGKLFSSSPEVDVLAGMDRLGMRAVVDHGQGGLFFKKRSPRTN